MMNGRRILGAAVLLLVGGALACMGGSQKPSAEILSPPSGSQVALGEEVSVEYRATDATAVVRVELEVGGEVMDSQNSPVPEGQPVMNGILNWTAEEAGSYTLVVYAYNKDRVASDPVGVSITVGEGEAVPGSTVTISLLIQGGTRTPESSATVPATGATATRPASTPSPTSTRPAAAPTATSTRPAPTATRPAPAPTQTQPPPTATRPAPTPTQTQVPPARIELINNSGEEVYFVYFGSPYHDFGVDQLGTDIVQPGSNYNWNVLAGTYHLLAVAFDGYPLSELWTADVHGHYQWTIPQTRQPAATGGIMLHNDSGQEIWYVYWSEAGQPFDWNDDKLGSSVVLAGEFFRWDGIPVGYYDLVALSQSQGQLGTAANIYVPPGDYYHWFVVL